LDIDSEVEYVSSEDRHQRYTAADRPRTSFRRKGHGTRYSERVTFVHISMYDGQIISYVMFLFIVPLIVFDLIPNRTPSPILQHKDWRHWTGQWLVLLSVAVHLIVEEFRIISHLRTSKPGLCTFLPSILLPTTPVPVSLLSAVCPRGFSLDLQVLKPFGTPRTANLRSWRPQSTLRSRSASRSGWVTLH
jgi:hypothetical protein